MLNNDPLSQPPCMLKLKNHASPWKKHENTTRAHQSAHWDGYLEKANFLDILDMSQLRSLHKTPPSSPAAEDHAGAYGRPPPLHSALLSPKGHWCSQYLCPYSTKGTGLHHSCQRHCVPSLPNNRDAFNLPCQALQYCQPQNSLFLLSQIQGMKNHQDDGFEYLSDSQVHSNTAISLGISLSFAVLKSIGVERS